MKTIQHLPKQHSNAKVAPLSCYCKLSLLVVHLKYLRDAPQPRQPTALMPALGEANSLFYQYI